MLRDYGIKYRAMSADVDEGKVQRSIKNPTPEKTACQLAFAKARAVLPRVKNGIVIGADTIVVIKDRIIGKPDSLKHAEKIISDLSHNEHRVITGICLLDAATMKMVVDYEVTRVRFKKLDKKWIKEYVRNNNVMDKAGAYAIQENRDPLIRSVKGSYNNVVGFPIEKVLKILKGWDNF